MTMIYVRELIQSYISHIKPITRPAADLSGSLSVLYSDLETAPAIKISFILIDDISPLHSADSLT